MARGDVVNDIQDIAAAGFLTFQPAAGVEVMITEIGSEVWTGSTPDFTPNCEVQMYDGSLTTLIRTAGEGQAWTRQLKLFVNNTNYLRIKNVSVSTQALSFTGIQTK